IVGAAWEQMPVQVRHLIAEQLAVHLARLESGVDGAGQSDHFFEKRDTHFGGQVMQLGRMDARDEHAISGMVLPGAKEDDGMRKLPDEFIAWQFLEFVTKRTG